MNWKEELKALKLAYIKEKSPGFYELSGGEKMKIKPYTDQTTNGLTSSVYDWLKYSGCYVNRINSTGMMRKVNGKMLYTYGSSNLGTADVDSIIYGIPIKIEIKNVNTKDRLRKHQREEKARIEAAGGIYLIIPDMQTFVIWFKEFINDKILHHGQKTENTVAQQFTNWYR